MRANFNPLGLINGGWFGGYFGDYHLFGYIGDRDRLRDEVTRKSLLRQVIELVLKNVNIATFISILPQIPVLSDIVGRGGDSDETVAGQIIDLVTKEENRRSTMQVLQKIYKQGRKQGRYFDRVSDEYMGSALFGATFNSLQDRLITVEGQLIHRSAISQFNRAFNTTLGASQGEWILADFPPHLLVVENSKFRGHVLLLSEEPDFTRIFGTYLPFWREIGWYPYVRVTGFFDSSRLAKEALPSLSVSLVEYRHPRSFLEVRKGLIDFIDSEFSIRSRTGNWNYLNSWADSILFGYLPPLLLKGSNLTASDVDQKVAGLLRAYYDETKENLPEALADFYEALPSAEESMLPPEA